MSLYIVFILFRHMYTIQITLTKSTLFLTLLYFFPSFFSVTPVISRVFLNNFQIIHLYPQPTDAVTFGRTRLAQLVLERHLVKLKPSFNDISDQDSWWLSQSTDSILSLDIIFRSVSL